MKVNLSATLIYLLLLYLMNLARNSVGGFFIYVYFALWTIPLAALIHLTITMFSLRYIQDFSSFHSVRGDEVDYRLRVIQEIPLFSADISIRFKHINPHMRQITEDRNITLKPGQRLNLEYSIPCPYIGIYTIGLEGLSVSDVFGWITLPLSVYFFNMYVYPRVLDSADFTPLALNHCRKAGNRLGTSVDYSYFERLEEYREGQDVRLMAWKRFAAQGVPMVRVYNRVSTRGVRLYLDTRRDGDGGAGLIEREDFSLELLVSLASLMLEESVPVTVRAWGIPALQLERREQLQDLIRSSLEIRFSPDADLFRMFGEDAGVYSEGSSLIITHDLSPELIRILSRPREGGYTTEAVINETGAGQETRELHRRRINVLGSAGGLLRFTDAAKIQGKHLVWQ